MTFDRHVYYRFSEAQASAILKEVLGAASQ